MGKTLNKIFTSKEEIIKLVEKAILLYREQGKTGERFAETVERLGFENVEGTGCSQMISWRENRRSWKRNFMRPAELPVKVRQRKLSADSGKGRFSR